MESVIIGAGAVGLGIGSCLHRAGHALHFLVRDGAPQRELERHGFRRSGIFGEVQVPAEAIEFSTDAGALRGRPIDFVLLCTKTTQTEAVTAALAPIWPTLPKTARLVLFQNGWGGAEQAGRHLPPERIDNARVITGFRRHSPTRVEITVHADAIHIGNLSGADPEPLRPLCESITRGGVACRIEPGIERDLWAKVLYNSLLNPLGALTRSAYGALGESAEKRAIMETVAREVFAVLAAAGRRTHWPDADSYLQSFYRDLLPATAAHESSMLEDLRAGRATEIDSICGAVVQLAAENGVPTPLCRALCELVHAAESLGGQPAQPPEKRGERFSRKARTPSA